MTDGTDAGGGVRDPEEVDATAGPAGGEIAPSAHPGAVHLTVADLARSIAYYERDIGLRVLERGEGTVVLGTGDTELLVLVEEPGARPSDGYTGLYHFALLVPERIDLATWLAHASRDGVALTGLSDHYVSEALYLRDPDGHGIEIYRDRPRDAWEGQVSERMTSIPLDVQDLMTALPAPDEASFDGLPGGTVMGHVHLKVASIPETLGFYRDVLGFGEMATLGPMATFLAAGGYHHHIGANTWESAGASPPPEGSAALLHAEILLPSDADRDQVVGRLEGAGAELADSPEGPITRDPSGNALLLAVA